MKKENWVSALEKEIVRYQTAPFKWGENDCLIFVADCIKAMTDFDFMEPWRGKYTNEDEAASLMIEHWNGKINRGWDPVASPIDNHKAQRGDFGTLQYTGKTYCGVVSLNARFLLVRTEEGIARLKLKNVDRLSLWRA